MALADTVTAIAAVIVIVIVVPISTTAATLIAAYVIDATTTTTAAAAAVIATFGALITFAAVAIVYHGGHLRRANLRYAIEPC